MGLQKVRSCWYSSVKVGKCSWKAFVSGRSTVPYRRLGLDVVGNKILSLVRMIKFQSPVRKVNGGCIWGEEERLNFDKCSICVTLLAASPG